MPDSSLKGLYEPLANIDAYLERIGFDGQLEATLPCLQNLMLGQLQNIPFEDLDVFHGHKEPSLETKALFDKLIINKRGGYCFELNGLFGRLLQAAGFTVRSLMARVVWHYPHLTPPSHQANIVTIDGKDYFCDVGFGGPIPYCPLPLILEEVQTCCVTGRTYRFTKAGNQITIAAEFEGGYKPMLMLLDSPCDPVDFVPLNCFCAHSPIEPFLHKQMVWLAAKEGRRSIDGDVLRIETKGITTETKLATEEDLRQALKTYFGICYNEAFSDWH